MPYIPSYDLLFPGSDNDEDDNDDDDDLFDEDMDALRKACMRVGADASSLAGCSSSSPTADGGAGLDSDGEDSSEAENLEFFKSLREKLAISGDLNQALSLKPLSVMLPEVVSDDDDDEALETFRAIQRRGEHRYQRPEQVRASSIPLEKGTSNNLFVNRTNACEGIPDFEDTCAISKAIEPSNYSVPMIQTPAQIEWDRLNGCQLLSLPPKGSGFPVAAQVFIDAIRKNRSYQKLLRNKLAQVETKIEVNQKLKERVKILEDFQVALRKRSGRALSQKKDARVQLFSAPKVVPSKHSKCNDRKLSAMSYGPAENSHVATYRMVLNSSPLSFNRLKWSTAEREAIGKGLRQEYQKTLLEKSAELVRGSDDIDNIITSIKNLEITDENIRLFLRNVDWNYFASIYIKGRSGAECEARWLNCEDPLINHNPWTHEEDKMLRMIVQERGLNNCIDIAVSLGTNRTPFQCLARYQRSLNPWIMKREWTKDEDAQLCAAVQVIGESKWQTVASTLEGRTGTQCSNRWKKSLHPAKKRVGRWTKDEDTRLKVAVMLFGPKTWRKVANFIPGRTDVQCRERWVNSLDPSVNWGDWTEYEDKRLLEAAEEHKYSWSKVALCIPHRTDSQCLRRWKQLCPDEVPKLQAVRKIQKAALISNFVDRESERSNLRPEDFVSLPMLTSPAECEIEKASRKSKRKSGNVTKKIRSKKPRKEAQICLNEVSEVFGPNEVSEVFEPNEVSEVFEPNEGSFLLMLTNSQDDEALIEHYSTSDMLLEQPSSLIEPTASQRSPILVSQSINGTGAESSCGNNGPSVIRKKRAPKRKEATNKRTPKPNSKKAKGLKTSLNQSSQSINYDGVKTLQQNIPPVSKKRASNQTVDAEHLRNHRPNKKISNENVFNNAHSLSTQSLDSEIASFHDELNRHQSLNLSYGESIGNGTANTVVISSLYPMSDLSTVINRKDILHSQNFSS